MTGEKNDAKIGLGDTQWQYRRRYGKPLLHDDAYVLIKPQADAKVCQGVTTEVIGNCGF